MKRKLREDNQWTLLGGIAKNNFRWQTVTIVAGTLNAFVTIALMFFLVDAHLTITDIAQSRVMFGFPDENGVFISTDKRPEAAVSRYARDYISNMKNFDADTVESNSKYAVSMMNPEKKLMAAQSIRIRNRKVLSNALHQSFIVNLESESLIENATGYIYKVSGFQKQFAGTLPLKDETGSRTIEVYLTKITPTVSRTIGLWIEGGKGL